MRRTPSCPRRSSSRSTSRRRRGRGSTSSCSSRSRSSGSRWPASRASWGLPRASRLHRMERGDGAGGVFPPTRWSAVVAARSGEAAERKRGLSRIAEAYWRPVYKLLRLRWGRSHEDARELTQEFFARVLEDDVLAGYDPAKGRLRTFLRTCLDALVMNDARDRTRLKRGGDREILSLDCEQAERELSSASFATPADADAFFEAEWVRSVFALAVARLRAECIERGRETVFDVFDRYDLQDREPRPTYAELAAEL